MYIYTIMHGTAKKNNNAVSDKLKVSHSLTSGGGTFVVYIVHPMCSDGYIKKKCVHK